MDYGYVRVSTTAQSADLQTDAMTAAGVQSDGIRREVASGAGRERPVLATLLDELREGDRLTVWRLDRLGRSLPHLISTLDDLRARGIEFRSLTEAIDTSTAGGRLVMHVVAAVAEFERDLIRERTTAGLAAAAARGHVGGRPPAANRAQADLVAKLAKEGSSHREIAMMTGLSRSAVGRLLRGEIATLTSNGKTEEPA